MQRAGARLAISVGLVLATFVVFAQVRHHEFVHYDDPKYLLEDLRLGDGISLAGLRSALVEPYFAMWIPLTTISYQIDRTLWGGAPAGTLLTNVALHAASAVLLFAAFWRLSGALWPSAFTAAVFAVHPLHVESVAWASERKDVLAGLLFMLALLLYGRYAERPSAARYAALLGAFALALLAKPTVVVLPVLLLLLDYWPLGRLQGESGRALPGGAALQRAVVEKLPLFALAGAASVVTWAMLQGSRPVLVGEGLFYRVGNALLSYVSYLTRSLWPTGLAVYYPHDLAAVASWRPWAAGVLLGLLSGLALLQARARPWALCGWLWFLVTPLPVIGIVEPFFHARADRYTYLAQIGLCVVVAWGARELAQRRPRAAGVLAVAGGAAVLGLAGVAGQQVRHWRDTETLFRRALAVTEGNFIAHLALGSAAERAGRLAEAEGHYMEAVRILPGWFLPHRALAQIRAKYGNREGAIDAYARWTRIGTHHAEGHARLGMALLQAGRPGRARLALERALELGSESSAVKAALAELRARYGDSGPAGSP